MNDKQNTGMYGIELLDNGTMRIFKVEDGDRYAGWKAMMRGEVHPAYAGRNNMFSPIEGFYAARRQYKDQQGKKIVYWVPIHYWYESTALHYVEWIKGKAKDTILRHGDAAKVQIDDRGRERTNLRALDDWTWIKPVSETPNANLFAISHKVFKDACEGNPWFWQNAAVEEVKAASPPPQRREPGQVPASNRAVTAGDNMPPQRLTPIESIPFATCLKNAEVLIAEADRVIKETITTEAQATAINDLQNTLADLYKAMPSFREKDPDTTTEMRRIHTLVEINDERWIGLRKRVEVKYKALKDGPLTDWARAKKKRQEEAAREAVAAGAAPEEQQRAGVKIGGAGRTTSLRTFKTAEIFDYDVALTHFSQTESIKKEVQKLADATIRASGVAPPGCKIHEEERVV